MKFIKELNPETKKLLERISKQSKFPQVRDRAKCIVLSYQGVSVTQLIQIFKVSKRTIYYWYERWETQPVAGIYNQKGRGRKTKLNERQSQQVKDWVNQEPKKLKKVVDKVSKKWGIDVSKETIKRIVKKFDMRWKRMKRGTSQTQAEWEIEAKIPKLKELKERDKKGEIDLRYLDEVGFSLFPNIPYAWQEKNQRITIKSSRSKQINVLGLMNRNNELDYEIHQKTIDSDTVISFFDKFSQNLEKPTVVVMDQASIHTSDKIFGKLEEWKKKNLEIFWLPAYSPKENLIEILWKFIKYEWIEIDAYNNLKTLLNYLKKVLDNIGKEYAINFV